eukprot:UN29908
MFTLIFSVMGFIVYNSKNCLPKIDDPYTDFKSSIIRFTHQNSERQLGILELGDLKSDIGIFLFHAFSNSRLMFEKFDVYYPTLKKYHIIAVDRPGFGLSTFSETHTPIQFIQNDIDYLIKYFKLKKYGFIGVSFGGMFALGTSVFLDPKVTLTISTPGPLDKVPNALETL